VPDTGCFILKDCKKQLTTLVFKSRRTQRDCMPGPDIAQASGKIASTKVRLPMATVSLK
jgi:hypothetical protein